MKIINRRTTRQPEQRTFGERQAERRAAENRIMGRERATAHRKARADLERQYLDISRQIKALGKRKDPAAVEEIEALLARLRSIAP